MKKAIFLDRDGTLVQIMRRPNHPEVKISMPWIYEELAFTPNAKEFLEKVKALGFLRILIANQPDPAYGYMKQEEWEKIQQEVERYLQLDDIFMCRHMRNENCPMRKPSPMMLLAAADKWGIDLSQSWMIGDTIKDVGAGQQAGCRTILIDADYNRDVQADFRVKSLEDSYCLLEHYFRR